MEIKVRLPDKASPVAMFYYELDPGNALPKMGFVSDMKPDATDLTCMAFIIIAMLSEATTPNEYRSAIRMILENKSDVLEEDSDSWETD